jgi:hypothetical protein
MVLGHQALVLQQLLSVSIAQLGHFQIPQHPQPFLPVLTALLDSFRMTVV